MLVVVPARDEEDEIGGALAGVAAAARLTDLPVVVTVVLHRCTDRTADRAAAVAREHPDVRWRPVESVAPTLGEARADGVGGARTAYLEEHGETAADALWVSSTDADSRVPSGWLATQRELADTGLDLVLGTVVPADDGGHPESARLWHLQHHLAEGHTAVHGANLGVRLSAYDAAGGFGQRDRGEDADLVHRVRRELGAPWTSTDRTRVSTSSRRHGRAHGGFARFLRRLDDALAAYGDTEALEVALREQILRLALERGPSRTLCPSEAAGVVDPGRRRALTHVARAVACTLADEGLVVVTQRGVVVDGRTTPGPVRVRLPGPDEAGVGVAGAAPTVPLGGVEPVRTA